MKISPMIFATILAICSMSTAYAAKPPHTRPSPHHRPPPHNCAPNCVSHPPIKAPEIDVGAGTQALVLLGGALMLLAEASRRRRRTKPF